MRRICAGVPILTKHSFAFNKECLPIFKIFNFTCRFLHWGLIPSNPHALKRLNHTVLHYSVIETDMHRRLSSDLLHIDVNGVHITLYFSHWLNLDLDFPGQNSLNEIQPLTHWPVQQNFKGILSILYYLIQYYSICNDV